MVAAHGARGLAPGVWSVPHLGNEAGLGTSPLSPGHSAKAALRGCHQQGGPAPGSPVGDSACQSVCWENARISLSPLKDPGTPYVSESAQAPGQELLRLSLSCPLKEEKEMPQYIGVMASTRQHQGEVSRHPFRTDGNLMKCHQRVKGRNRVPWT